MSVKERSAVMGGSPGILTGFDAIDKAYPTGMAPGHLIVAIGWPGKVKHGLLHILLVRHGNKALSQ